MALTVKAALHRARQQFKTEGVASPELDAEVLLTHVTGLDRAGLYREGERLLGSEEESRFFDLAGRRLSGEPVAYLTGHKEFMGLDFLVSPAVLIPRPETELLVETALRELPPSPILVDVGTGSGAIAVSLASFLPDAVVYAMDCSREALAVARLNAERHGVAERVFFLPGDLLEPLKASIPRGGVDLIAANLPYIAEDELSGLPPGVCRFEPVLALNGGAGGLDLYRRLIPGAAGCLKQGGLLLMEIGWDQGREALAMLRPPVWEARLAKDLAGLDRLVVAKITRA